MMCLAHNGSTNTKTIPSAYVHVNENHIECGLQVVTSFLGLRLERHNQLFFIHSFTILIDSQNPIRHHIYECEFWLEELDKMMCCDT